MSFFLSSFSPSVPTSTPEKKRSNFTCVKNSPVGGCFETCTASTHHARAKTFEDHALDLQTAQVPAWASDRAGSGGREEEEEGAADEEAEFDLRWFLRMTDAAPWTSACT